jgi:cyclic pyranopterin phosphate synthase
MPFMQPCEILAAGEIVKAIRIFSEMGIRRVRLTGGEPLLREDIVEIVCAIKKIGLIEDLSVTTNGSLLEPLLAPLKQAGLDRLNISMDSLDPKRFQSITLSDSYDKVYRATEAALAFGFPVKLNMVVLKGLADEEIISFVKLAQRTPLEVRFLEFMPLCGEGWDPDFVLPIAEVKKVVFREFEMSEDEPKSGQVAQTFTLSGTGGKVGFIASLTESFCDRCSRIRLTANGRIRPCLFSDVEVSLWSLLRDGASDEEIKESIKLAAAVKPAGNAYRDKPFDSSSGEFSRPAVPSKAVMRRIGG